MEKRIDIGTRNSMSSEKLRSRHKSSSKTLVDRLTPGTKGRLFASVVCLLHQEKAIDWEKLRKLEPYNGLSKSGISIILPLVKTLH